VTLREEIGQPGTEWPLSVAVEEVTGFEILGIQKHFGLDFGDLGAARLLMAVVWALENRSRQGTTTGPVTWFDVESLSLRQLNGYFSAEPVEAEEDNPSTELGKGS
jgi:hypothetical protein